MSRRAFRLRVVATLLVVGALAACVVDPLNPQPLPPGPMDGVGFFDDAGAKQTVDGGLVTAPAPGGDASSTVNDDGAAANVPADAGITDAEADGATDASTDASTDGAPD